MRHQRLLWSLPVLNGISIALTLWAMNDFDLSRASGEWAFIALVASAYVWLVRGIPVEGLVRRERQETARSPEVKHSN